MKRFRYLICCLIVSVLGILSPGVPVRAETEKTVRIGLYNKDNYHIIDDHSRHSGYDHEYLLEIAKYTGWEYEYVQGTWQECMEMLEQGRIDLLGGVGISDELPTVLYAKEPSAYASNCLLIDENSDRYAYEDFEAFDGMCVGILADSAIGTDLEEYAAGNHFSYTSRQYATEEDMNRALEQGEIDCIGLSDFRNLSRYKIIARLSDTSLYYAVTEKRPDLKVELDAALRKIHQQNRFYEAQIYDKYFNSAHQVAFSKEELAYLEKHKNVQVALFSDIPQVCEFDADSGEKKGFIFQIFDRLEAETGVKFQYTALPLDEMPWDYLYDHPNVILAPLFQNDLIHYSERMRFSNAIVPGKMIAVTNKKTVSEIVNNTRSFKLAVPAGMFGASQELQLLFPNCELVFCDSHQDGMNMVWHGKADMTIVNEILGSYLLQSPYYKELNTGYLNQVMENVTIGMGSSSDVMLMSIFNKVIQSFSQSDIQQMVMEYTAKNPYRKDFKEQIYEKWLLLVILLAVSAAGGTSWYIYSRQKKLWLEQRVQLKVTEEKLKTEEKYKKELFQRANFDELTGLYSQRYFSEEADALEKRNPDKVYGYFLVNISSFKLVNELYGTQRGDCVLLEMAEMLRRMAGQEALLGRLYADQFVLCCPIGDKTPEELLRDNTLYYFVCGGRSIRVQIRVGIYINEQHSANAEQAVTYARVALQNHGDAGNNIYIYRQEYMDRLLESQTLTNEMENALREKQFKVYLQPQYNIGTKELVAAEALVRWEHPVRGVIPPNHFIPVFEMNGFTTQLDIYMLEEVCILLAKWKKEGRMLPVSVNLSRLDLLNPELVPRILEITGAYGIPAEYLHLEITESAYVEDHGAFYQVIGRLRQEGFIIEMDDFGSGYSSLNMLKEIPVDVIKLDMKFFSEETHMERGGSIIESIVSLAHSLGILVVTEGVETEREANFLLSIRCMIAQGYLYSRPVPVEVFEKMLKDGKLGSKMSVLSRKEGVHTENLYWSVEQMNVLLRHSGMLLFDYDPMDDVMHFTSGKEGALLNIQEVRHFVRNLGTNEAIHPDDRESLRRALTLDTPNSVKVAFSADSRREGSFRRFCATACHYSTEGHLKRVVGFVEKEQGDFWQKQNC